MPAPRLSLLLLADTDRRHADALKDHVAAFRRYSRHRVRVVDPIERTDPLDLWLDAYDVVVLHWSIVPHLDAYLAPPLRQAIAAFSGLKIQFIQDEYRWVEIVAASIRELGIGVLYTVVPNSEVSKLYGGRIPGVELVGTLTGFVPERLESVETPPPGARPVDIAYRGRDLPFWLGRLAHEKAQIGKAVLAAAGNQRLRCDIAWTEDARVYGDAWQALLVSAKATLGTPSGASIADYDGTVEQATRDYIARHPAAGFEEVHAAVLEAYEGNILIDVVSPRIFEAAALRTALILYPSRYSDLLEPGVHYLPLERDLSNFGEVVATLRDEARLIELTERAHADLVASGQHSLRRFVAEFDAVVDRRGHRRRAPATPAQLARRSARRIRVRAGARLRPSVRPFKSLLALSFATARFTLSSSALRRLWLVYLARAELRRAVPLEQFGGDLLRVGLIRNGRSLTPPFTAVVDSSDDGIVRLVSRAAGAEADAVALAAALGAVRQGGLRTLVWNHSAVGVEVVHRALPGMRIGIPVGAYQRVDGIHRFAALEQAARVTPAVVADAVEDALAAR